MAKFFNCSGPCVPGDHYMIDPFERMEGIRALIDEKRYFVLHAPRQTGKTTNMVQLAKRLNQEGKYVALYANVEAAQALRNDVEKANWSIVGALVRQAKIHLPQEYRPSLECRNVVSKSEAMSDFLSQWCLELPKPLVLFLDEVDALIGDSLISVLRQLRQGYNERPESFPHSLCIMGLRDIRDYRIFSDSSQRYVVGGSAFNIKEKSVTVQYFTPAQVDQLYRQHTEETGQQFEREALDAVFYYSQGQPWLVNAIGRELCFEKHAVPRGQTVTAADVDRIVEVLILRRDVHLDQLADKLTEPRIARVIEPILMGAEEDQIAERINQEDIQYLIDLGLIRRSSEGLEIANPIYQEIIPRELTSVRQDFLAQNPAWYQLPNGKLDMEKLLSAFIEFYRENGEMMTTRELYPEAAHHLLFMAWLQRLVNGGGRITREYALGRKRLDLCVDFAGEKFAIELKLDSKKALSEGKDQLAGYLNRLGLDKGTLILFHRGAVEDWEALGKREAVEHQGKTLDLIWL